MGKRGKSLSFQLLSQLRAQRGWKWRKGGREGGREEGHVHTLPRYVTQSQRPLKWTGPSCCA